MAQERTDDDVESDTESEEPSEELSEETDEDPSEESSDEPSEEPVQFSRSSDNNDREHQSKFVQANSAKNKRSLDNSTGQEGVVQVQSQKKYKQERSMEPDSDAWPATTNLLNKTLVSDGNASQGQEKGSSGKRRRSRWEPQQGGDGEAVEADVTCKRRKTRWAGDDSQLKMLGPIQLPDFVKGLVAGADIDPKIHDLNTRLVVINKKLQGTMVLDDRPEEERSPSPSPVYNNLGIRINTREVRLREKLIRERQDIISRLIQNNPTFKPPSDYKSKFYKKLYVPLKEYPGYNFIGLIIGPRGNTQKKMEKETGARILIRGKGSVKDGRTQNRRDMKPDPSENEDLHVLVEADSQMSLDTAVGMVEKLLVPVEEGMNEHKRAQLMELAKLNGTLKDTISCRVCGEPGHMQYLCPSRNSKVKIDTSCDVCGGGHPTTSCPLTASDSGNKMDNQFRSVLSDIGGGSAVFGVSPVPSSSIPGRGNQAISGSSCFYGSYSNTGLVSTAASESKPNKEIDDSNLYVGYLPPELDDNQLAELFSPFGSITSAKVIKDRTTGLSKGYGFVKYTDPVSAAKAVENMNEHRINGKVLAVRVAGRPQSALLNSGIVGTTAIALLPPYFGPPSVPQDNLGQSAWPGPPGSMLPEPCFPKSDALGLPPVNSGKNDSFCGQSPSYYVSYHMTSSPSRFAPFSSNLTGTTDWQSDYVNSQIPPPYGPSSSKIPISMPSMLSQLPGDLSSSPSYLGQSDLFSRHSPSSYGSSYENPVSLSSALANFPGNLRSSPGYLAQTDSLRRQFPSHRSSY